MLGEITQEFFDNIGIVVLIGGILFFVMREIHCWYYRINEIIARMDKQDRLLDNKLSEINNQLSYIIENGLTIKTETTIDKNIQKFDEILDFNKTQVESEFDIKEKRSINNSIYKDSISERKIELPIDNVKKEKSSIKDILTKEYFVKDLFRKKR